MARSVVRTGAKIFAAFFVIVLVGLVSLFLLVRSQYFLGAVLPKVQAELRARAGVELSVGEMRLEWLRDIAIRDVRARLQNDAVGDVEAHIGSLRIQLSLWSLLHKNVQLNSVELVDAKIKAILKQGPEAPPSEPSNPIALLASLLEDPPITVAIPQLRVKNLALNTTVLMRDGGQASFELNKINSNVSISLAKGELEASLLLELGEEENPASLLLGARKLPGVQAADLRSQLSFRFDTELSIKKDDAGWWLGIPKGDAHLRMTQMDASVTQKNQRSTAELSRFEFSQKGLKPLRLSLNEIMALRTEAADAWMARLQEKIPGILDSMDIEVSRQISLEVEGLKADVRLQQLQAALSASAALGTTTHLDLKDGVLGLSLTDTTLVFSQVSAALGKKPSVGFGKLEAAPAFQLSVPLRALLEFPKTKDVAALVGSISALRAGGDVRIEAPRGIPVKVAKPIKASAHVNFLRAERAFDVTSEVFWGEARFASAHVVLADNPKKLSVKTDAELRVLPEFVVLHPAALVINNYGGANITASVFADLEHASKSIFSFKPSMIAGLKLKANVQANVDQVALDGMKNLEVRYKNLKADLQTEVDVSANRYTVQGGVRLLGKPLSEFRFEGKDSARVFKIAGRVAANVEPDFSDIHKSASDLKKFGKIEGGATFDVSVGHPFASIVAFNPKALGGPHGPLTLNAKIESQVALPGAHRVVSDFETSKLLSYVRLGEPYVQTARVELAATTDLQKRARVQLLTIDAGGKKVLVSAMGESDIKAENVDMRGTVELALPPEVPLNKKTKLKANGRVRIPWQLRRVGGRDFHLSGKAELLQVGAELGALAVRNMSGAVVFSQDLRLENKNSLAWARILDVSPFLRVDTDRIRPYLMNTPLVRIPEIEVLGRKVGPLRARVALMQNQLSLEDVDLSLFDGAYTGKIFMDLQPKSPRFALLGRLAGLDTSLINSVKGKSQVAASANNNKYLAARLAFGVDVAKSLAEGRIDITEMGSAQLKALIQVLDPEGKDAMLNAARMGLTAGYPTYVGLNMVQGYLDLAVQLGGIAPLRIDARQLPLTSILTPYTHSMMNSLRGVPLK